MSTLTLDRVQNTETFNEDLQGKGIGPSSTVRELVIAAQDGDRDAMGLLFERYHDMVVAVANRRVRDVDEAEELAQDVFVQAMQKIDQLRVPEAFGGWLRQITGRMAINRLTRHRYAVACDPDTLSATCVGDDCPVTNVEDREDADVIHRQLNGLGVMDRETLQAFYMHSKSLVEMSVQFDAPIGTIKRRLHVARKRLAERMD